MLNEIVANIGSGLVQYRQDYASGNWPGALAVYLVNPQEVNLLVGAVWSSGFTITSGVGTRLPPRAAGTSNLSYRKELWIYNNDNTSTIFIGQSGVTVDNGFPVPTGTSIKLSVAGNIDVWAICQSASAQVKTLEIS